MNAKIIPLDAEPPSKGIGPVIEWLAEKHAKGELSSILVTVVYRDGCSGFQHSELLSFSAMVGAIERAKYAILKEADD